MALVPIALAVFTLVVLVEPGVSRRSSTSRLALAIDAVATGRGGRHSGRGRYREGGEEAALWRASALLVLGTINALGRRDDPAWRARSGCPSKSQLPLWASVLTRGPAGGR